ISKYAAAHGEEIRQMTRKADQEAVRRGMSGSPQEIGVAFEMKPLPKPVEILVGDISRVPNPRSGREMLAMAEKMTPVRMLDYGTFEAPRKVPAAFAYLFAPEPGLQISIAKLQSHGVVVEELTAPLNVEVESFTMEKVTRAQRPFQGHNEVKLTGKFS